MKKRILSLLLVGMMILTLIPLSASADEKTVITEIVATYDFVQPTYGQEIDKDITFDFTVEGGLPITFSSNGFDWYKYVNEDWGDVDFGYFSEGTWCHDIQVVLDDTDNYEFAPEGVDVIINGVKWDTIQGEGWIKSPSFEIEFVEGHTLAFYSHDNYYVPTNYVGIAISEYTFAPGVIGGSRPYTFSKTSGPDWLNVSADGVLSGTPTVVGENDDLYVTVTDANGATDSLAVYVRNTYMNPADREVVSRVVGTVEVPSFKCGDDLEFDSAPVLLEGYPATLSVSGSDFYLIDSEDNVGETVYIATYGETYIYDICVSIGGDAGRTHVLDENLEVVINGVSTTVTPVISDDDSYKWVEVMQKVTAEHWFDNDSDSTCNGCGAVVREGCDHQYDDDCDEDCNVCSALRDVNHNYTNDCDADCNDCGEIRVPSDHRYSGCNDAYCDECGAYRNTPVHTYDGCSDTICNVCGEEREPAHIYDGALDTTCNSCGETRVLNYIKLNEEKVAEITSGGQYVDYIFTPDVSGTFVFASHCDDSIFDTKGYIFDENGQELFYDDDSAGNRQFMLEYGFEAGETYILRAMFYGDSQTGSIPVSIVCNHIYDDDSDNRCNICNYNRSGAILGDINGDDEVNATDYILAKRAVMSTYTMNETQILAGDINGDGEVNATDYILLKRAVMGTYVIG